jgi:hypothetical protein
MGFLVEMMVYSWFVPSRDDEECGGSKAESYDEDLNFFRRSKSALVVGGLQIS